MPLFISHGIEQGAIAGVLARLGGASPLGVASAFALAGAINTVPDTWPFAVAVLNPKHPNVVWCKWGFIRYPYRFDLKEWLHNGGGPKWLRWMWWTHLRVDKPFHALGENWFDKREGKRRMINLWILEAIGIFLCFY